MTDLFFIKFNKDYDIKKCMTNFIKHTLSTWLSEHVGTNIISIGNLYNLSCSYCEFQYLESSDKYISTKISPI